MTYHIHRVSKIMNVLPENFEMERYRIKTRLVTESDAPFILLLRTDERLSKFLHKTENDLSKQIEWIKTYKKREREGLDYYFIYSYAGCPFGLNRIYNIHEGCVTGGKLGMQTRQ